MALETKNSTSGMRTAKPEILKNVAIYLPFEILGLSFYAPKKQTLRMRP